MPDQVANPNSPKDPASVSETRRAAKVTLKTTYSVDIFSRLDKFSKDKGLPDCQDTIRLAVVSFLERNGY